MNSPFQPKKLNVPGLMGDDALNESLKQFAAGQNALQGAAPPPDSAVDMVDKIQNEYLKAPAAPSLRGVTAALPGPLGLLAGSVGDVANGQAPGPAPVDPQQRAVDVRSNILSDAAAAIPAPFRDFVLGPAYGQLGPGGGLNALGTLTPEESQAEADQRAKDATANEAAVRDHAAMRDKLRSLSDEDAAAMGLPVAPGGTPEEAKAEGAKQDAGIVAEAAKRNQEAIAATKDPKLQPKQTWWLNAMQSGVQGAAEMGIGGVRFATELGEMARDASGADLLTGGGRSDARAWIDTVDATLTKMLPGDKARSKDFVTQLSQGTGSMLGFMVAGFAGATAGVPVGLSTAVLGAATQGDQQFQDAERFNATGLQKYMALMLGAGLGTTEAIPLDRMFMRADAATGGLVRRMLSSSLAGSMQEFTQEFGQAVGQDVVAKWLYDEKRKLDWGSYFKQGLVGAITGGLTDAAVHALHESGVSTQPADATPPEQRQALAQRVIDTLSQQLDQLPGMKEHNAAQLAEAPLANIAPPEPVPGQQVVQGPGGNIPVNANGQFEAHHSSGQQLDIIDPAKRGTGPLRGQERNRLFGPDAVDRSYFGVGDPNFVRPAGQSYKLDTDPYHGEGLGPLRHTIEADPKTIYNWFEDPLNLKSQLDRSTPASEQVTRYEKLIKDAGFKGVYFSQSPIGQTAAMFEATKPTKVVDQRYELSPSEIATLKDFANPTEETFTNKGGWAVVTATQEAQGDANAPANIAANDKLRNELKKKGIPFQEVGGTYQGVDQGKSFLVFMPEKQAVQLGKKYKQESVLTRKGLEYSDGRLVPAIPSQTVVGDKAKANDFYSTLPNGKAFSVGLDFGADQLANRAPVRGEPLPMFPERTDQSFDRWFGDSVVVNPDGTPKAVFHGTPTKDGFRIFDPNKTGKTSVLFSVIDTHRNGFFFAENEEFAKTFADQGRVPGKVIPVFLSIQNPLDVTESTRSAVNALEEIGLRAQEIDPSITNPGFFADRAGRDDFWEVLDTPEGGDAFVQAAKELGYDGIRMYEPNHDNRDSELVWVAFDNTQIKSAEENTGAYSPTNPDIHANQGTATNRAPMTGEQTRPAAGIPSAPGAEQSDASLSSISQGFTKLLGLTVRQGRFTLKGPGVVGQYDRRTAVIRTKTQNDLSNIVHEAGHDIYFKAGTNLQQFIAGNDAALMKVADDLYGGDTNLLKKSTHIAEGFAEFFRVYTLNRAYAEKHYPTLVDEFDTVLDKDAPQLKAGLALVGQQYAAWLQLPSAQLVRNMIVSGQRDGTVNAALKELQDAGFGTWMHEISRRAVDASVNRYAALNDVVSQILNTGQENKGKAIDLKRSEDPRVLQRLATNAGARAMVETTDGVMGYNSTDPMTRGLREALLRYHGKRADQNLFRIDPVRQADFAAYIVALRGIDEYRRFSEGKIERPPLAATLGDLQVTVKEMEGKYGTDFSEAAKIANEYAMGLWQKAFDAGLMTEETFNDGQDRQFYVPLQRDMSDKKASLGASALTGSSSLVKRFRGSDRDIVDPMDVLMHKTFALEQIISRNEVFRTLGALADRAGKVGALVERVPSKQLMGKQLSVKEVARQLTKDDTISAADAEDLMTILQASIDNDNAIDFFRSEPVQTKGENIVFGWENGRLAALQLADGDLGADVVNVINGLGRENLPLFTSIISATTTAFRAGIVSWPDFIVANFIKDQFSAFILTDVGYKPFVSGLRGVYDELRQKGWAKQYNGAMGAMGGMNVANLHKSRINRDIGALRGKGYVVKAFTGKDGVLSNGLEGFMRTIEITETGTRLGVFKSAYERARKDGLSEWDASVEASYTATDMMDFGLNGSRMALYRKTIPFLNAQLQGLYKMMRTLGADEVRQRKGLNFVVRAYFKSMNNVDLSRTEKQAINTGRKAWIKMASLGLLSAALHYLFRDDPDYQEASEYLRVTGWVIPLGDGRIFYIPKPYELAVLANFTERALESSEGDKEAMDRFGRGLAMTFGPPLAPPLIKTIVETTLNKDSFTGNEIVPSYMQALTPELQFNNYTSTLAKQLGSALNMSPMKIDHVMSSLGASAYRDIMSMYNTTDPNRGNMDATDAPILRRFIRDVRRGSTSSQDFWGLASTLNGTLRSAEVTYKAFLEAGNERAANDFLNTLDEDAKAYAILTTDFKADAKRLNPFYRARQLTTIVSAMRREMVTPLGLTDTTTKTSPELKLTAKEKTSLDDALSEYARREMRNTLVAMQAPGWAGKKMVDTKTTLNLIGAIDPRVRDELQRRIDKAKVYDFKMIVQYWPEVKNRLLRDHENSFLDDILSVAKVMR